MLHAKAEQAVAANCADNVHPAEWDREQILVDLEAANLRGIAKRVPAEKLEPLAKEEMVALLAREADAMYTEKEERMVGRYPDLDGPALREALRNLERGTMLQIIDRLWIDHLYTMDSLRQGIGLRSWGQKDPRVEYEKEAFELFEDLKVAIQEEFLTAMFQGEDFHIVVQQQQPPPPSQTGLTEGPPQQIPDSPMPMPDARALRRFDQLHSNRDEASGPAPVRKSDKKGS